MQLVGPTLLSGDKSHVVVYTHIVARGLVLLLEPSTGTEADDGKHWGGVGVVRLHNAMDPFSQCYVSDF